MIAVPGCRSELEVAGCCMVKLPPQPFYLLLTEWILSTGRFLRVVVLKL